MARRDVKADCYPVHAPRKRHELVMFGGANTPPGMRTGLALALACLALVQVGGCVPRPQQPVAPSSRPFDAPPAVALIDNQQPGPLYRVQLTADLMRDVVPTDDLAFVVSVGDHEVGRYPIVGSFERRPTRVRQEVELPLGDYELELDYRGTRFAGMPFRLARVPVWGGHTAVQLRVHPGTRVSLREHKLWVGRWWANDGLPQAWIIEWVYEGKVITTTSGREARGILPSVSAIVGGAAAAFRDPRVGENTIWSYGETYPVPDLVAQKPGPWAARIVHGGSSPVSIVFEVATGGRLAIVSPRRIPTANWQPSWSPRLPARALSITEVERLTAKLPELSASQPFDTGDDQGGLEPPIRVSTSAVRALFRSRVLAEAWQQYLALNHAPWSSPAPTSSIASRRAVDAAAFPRTASRGGAPSTLPPREPTAREVADRRAKLRALRAQIESLIKTHGGPWKPEEFPRT